MEFEIKSGSTDINKSVFYFPGDESICQQDYEDCIGAGYASSVATLAGALEGFGVDIDRETFERYKRTASVIGLCDDLLDESQSIYMGYEAFNQAISTAANGGDFELTAWSDNRLITALQLYGNCFTVLSRDKQERILMAAEGIASLAMIKSSCTDADEYSSLLKAEGRLTNVLVAEATSDTVQRDPRFKAFIEWSELALEAGTLTNSLLDLRDDYIRRLTSVEPSIRNRARIANHLHETLGDLIRRPGSISATQKGLITRAKY